MAVFFSIREQDIESVLINPRKEIHQWGWTPPWRFIKVYGKYLTSLTHKAMIPFHWCQDIFVQRVMTEPLGSGASVFIAGMQNHLEQHPLWSSGMSNGCVGPWSPLSNICRISNSITGEMGKGRVRGGGCGQGQKLKKSHVCSGSLAKSKTVWVYRAMEKTLAQYIGYKHILDWKVRKWNLGF